MINFADKALPSYIKVRGIQHSVLPPINHKSATVLGRAGAYDFGVDLGMRKITVDIQIIAANERDIMSKASNLASWLFYEDLQPLIFEDEPDKQYMARIVGDTELAEIYRTGEGSLEFVCPDAYKDSIVEKEVLAAPFASANIDDSMIELYNAGSAKTYPVVDLLMKQDASSIALISNDDYIMLGESIATKTVVDNQPLVLSDNMDTYIGYSTGINPDGGTKTGTFSSNGYSLKQASDDFGTGSSWHGATAIKTLSRTLQDFSLQAEFGHIADRADQVGRVEVYLLDSNNVHLGKISFVDTSLTGNHPKVEARAGSLTGGHYFANSYGDSKGVMRSTNPGIMKISRIGNRWTFYYAKKDSKGKHHTRLTRTWTDTKNWYGATVAKVMIHIGAYSDKKPVKTMYLSDLKVWDKGITVNDDTQTGTPFKTGDIVTIDNSKAVILLNGEPAYTLLDPSSSFFPIEPGVNALILSPPIADVTVKYRERWL